MLNNGGVSEYSFRPLSCYRYVRGRVKDCFLLFSLIERFMLGKALIHVIYIHFPTDKLVRGDRFLETLHSSLFGV